jgi:hypothetical protein
MSDTDKPEIETTTEEKPNKDFLQPTSLPGTPTAPPGVLTRPSDLTARPGFRSPPNNKSKAMKPGGKKK